MYIKSNMSLNSQPQYPHHLQHKADPFKFEEERAYCFAHVGRSVGLSVCLSVGRSGLSVCLSICNLFVSDQ